MSGNIVDASLVTAPKQRSTDGERNAIKADKSADEIWQDEPAKGILAFLGHGQLREVSTLEIRKSDRARYKTTI